MEIQKVSDLEILTRDIVESLSVWRAGKYIYKTVEEYDDELHKISKQINNVIYEEIISDLQTIYNEYIFDGSISNSCYEVYLFGIMEIEYFKLIKYLKNNNKYTLST